MPEPEIVMLVTKIPCNSITKRQDQTLNVRVNYTYKGPAITGRLGAVVTQKTFFSEFDEIGSTRKEVYIDLPASDTPAPSYTDIIGMPLAGCEPKSGYGIKVYALDLDGKPEWGCLNMLTVSEMVVEYTLSVSVAAPAVGYVIKSPDKATYTAGESVTLTAYLDSWAVGSYVFDHWVINGVTRTSNPITIIMDSNKTVTAYFKEIAVEKYTLTTSVSPSGAGYVVGGGTYNAGEVVMVYAESSPGYAFDHWGGDASGTWSPTYITMDRNKHVTAYFKTVAPPPEEHSLSTSVTPAAVGYVAKVPSKFTYEHGEVVTLTAHLYSQYVGYYYFDHWTVNGVARVGNPTNIVMDEDKVVVAVFIWSGEF